MIMVAATGAGLGTLFKTIFIIIAVVGFLVTSVILKVLKDKNQKDPEYEAKREKRAAEYAKQTHNESMQNEQLARDFQNYSAQYGINPQKDTEDFD